MIKLGIDLDNTIICYDELIYKLAKNKFSKLNLNKNLKSKNIIKSEIINKYNNEEWTKLQGLIFSEKLKYASLFDDFYNAIEELKNYYDIYIISHKTKYPSIGKKINLRNASKKFLKNNNISYCKNELIKSENIFFANTKKEKIEIIKKNKIDIFIDDLDEILKNLPKNIYKIHFSKNKLQFKNLFTWKKIKNFLILNKIFFLENKIKKIILSEIKIIKKINLGSNNEVYLINYKKKKSILKIYKNNKENYSFSKELFFLKKTKLINQTPSIKYYNKKFSFIIMNFIKGSKIKKISLNDIRKVINFINLIQKQKKNYIKLTNSKIKFATDKVTKITEIFENIDNRIQKTDLRIKTSRLHNSKLSKTIYLIKKKYRETKINFLKEKIKFSKKNNLILSPSDFNINNIIKHKNKISFIDFEYSGLDSAYKLVLDFISQPDIKVNILMIKYLIKNFNKMSRNSKIKVSLNLQILNNIKWFYIILNSRYKNNFLISQINKSQKYFTDRILRINKF